MIGRLLGIRSPSESYLAWGKKVSGAKLTKRERRLAKGIDSLHASLPPVEPWWFYDGDTTREDERDGR